MNITREHLAGLELALDIVRARSLIRKTGMIDGNNLHATLSDLIAQAQAAPVAEAVACWLKSNHPGADFVVIGNPEDIHAAATDLKIPLYTHPHDAELVELLRGLVYIADKKNRGRTGSPNHAHSAPGVWDSDNGELAGKPCAECAIYDHARAKLATLRHV
jgi:hypothetical protein